MATKILTAFKLTGKGIDPEKITVFLGIKPTKSWRLGDQIQNSALRRKHDGWVLSTERVESLDLDEQVRVVLNQLEPHVSKIKELCVRMDLRAEIECVVYIENDEVPALHFSKDIVKFAADLNAEIDIDLYL